MVTAVPKAQPESSRCGVIVMVFDPTAAFTASSSEGAADGVAAHVVLVKMIAMIMRMPEAMHGLTRASALTEQIQNIHRT